MGDIQSVFPGNQMPVQPRPSGDEEDGVGVFFISRQLMFTALLSVPVITHLLLLGGMRTSARSRRNSEPRSYNEKENTLGAFSKIDYHKDGNEFLFFQSALQ